MLSRGETVGVFQVESAGMRKALIGMKPDCIEDIIALVALYRPGPMENIPTYNARKHGEEEIASIHPMIDHLLKETQGVIVYQEQVMQIAQVLSGYSLGEADLLRRAMGKKIRAEMDKQRERFVAGAIENGVSKPQADFIFDLLAKFADYGFNKSHAAAYAVVSYQTAYLKAHYPVEFLAASMTLDMANTDKLADFRQDAHAARHRGRAAVGADLVPRISRSARTASIYALAAIKGVGEAAVEHIVAKRGEKPFAEPRGFLRAHRSQDRRQARLRKPDHGRRVRLLRPRPRRADGRRRAHDGPCLARAGRTPPPASPTCSARRSAPVARSSCICRPPMPWLPADRLHREFQVVGFYLSAHPLDDYKAVLEKMRVQTWADFSAAVKRGATAGRLAGTVTSKQERKTRTGNKMGVVAFSDTSGQYEAVLFSEGAGAVSRPAGARQIRRHHRRGRGPAGRHQPAHPDGAVAGGRGEPRAEGAAHLRARCRAAQHAGQPARPPGARGR